MAWLAVSGAQDCWTCPDCPHGDELLVRGSLVLEMQLPETARPEPLILFSQDGSWPLKLALRAVPGGGLNLVLEQCGSVLHHTLNPTGSGRTDRLRLTYSWDAPALSGRLVLERAGGGEVQTAVLSAPRPWRLRDLLQLLQPGPLRYVSQDVVFMALSDQLEPTGPMPGLDPQTPVATPEGYKPLSSLQRGDIVITPEGTQVPVLHVVQRQVPAKGAFCPVRLRAPYFGLQQDLAVAPFQRLVLSGSEVEYMFGRQSVLVPARHLLGTQTAVPGTTRGPAPLITYAQAILPGHEPLQAAGAAVESLYLGRIRRSPARYGASLLSDLPRHSLPEHGQPKYPVLRAFDAAVLAERRTA